MTKGTGSVLFPRAVAPRAAMCYDPRLIRPCTCRVSSVSFSQGFVMRVLLVVAGLWVTLALAPIQAQAPNAHLDGVNRIKAKFLEESLREVTGFLIRWRDALASDDAKKVTEYFTEDGFLSLSRGESVQGRRDVRSQFEALLPSLEGFNSTLIDFTASGGMAYQYGRYTQAIKDERGITTPERGTYVLILYRDGRDWKIRSYVERTDADPV